MASLEEWTKWKDEYHSTFYSIVTCAPILLAAAVLGEKSRTLKRGGDLFMKAHDKELSILDSSYFFKAYFFLCYPLLKMTGYKNTVEDAEKAYNDPKIKKWSISTINNDAQEYYVYIDYAIIRPALQVCRHLVVNNPFLYKKTLLRFSELMGKQFNLSYCKLSSKRLFDYFKSMSRYGLYKLLTDMNCPATDELFEYIQKGKYRAYMALCEKKSIDFSEIAELAGAIMNTEGLSRYDPDYIPQFNDFSSMINAPKSRLIDNKELSYAPELVGKLFPFTSSDEKAFDIVKLAFDYSGLYLYFENMNNEERMLTYSLTDDSNAIAFFKLSQLIYYGWASSYPKNVNIYPTEEELEYYLSLLKAKGISHTNNLEGRPIEGKENLASNTSSSSNSSLANRWMTEPYQRMQDDTLVELISQKIWPQLLEEVDGLQWTPAKRALPSFEKTKNMLAACILFHALELAKIAKLPKQEEDEVSDVEYMSAEDRAQAGISATSNRDAGIVHTKKKYNDTLPLGYMEVLEKFIPEEELPGRTTSRTYLKLVNKWVKMKLESVRDNIDSEASAKLFIAECKSDLGPQFYLYQDNRVKMKALLKEWKDKLPEIFNVPI